MFKNNIFLFFWFIFFVQKLESGFNFGFDKKKSIILGSILLGLYGSYKSYNFYKNYKDKIDKTDEINKNKTDEIDEIDEISYINAVKRYDEKMKFYEAEMKKYYESLQKMDTVIQPKKPNEPKRSSFSKKKIKE